MSELFECEEVILEHESLIYFMKTFEIICICFGSIFTFLTVIQFIFVDRLNTIYIHTQFQVSFKSYYFTVWTFQKFTLTNFQKLREINYLQSRLFSRNIFQRRVIFLFFHTVCLLPIHIVEI